MTYLYSNAVCSIGYLLGAILHFSGLFLLCKSKNDHPNQKILIINLAVVEMLYCLSMVINISVRLSRHVNTKILEIISEEFLSTLFLLEIRLTMLHIIFDRFLEIFTNIKYSLYMNRKAILKIISMHWIISFVNAIISCILQHLPRESGYKRLLFTFSMCLVLDVMILVSSITTYIYFYAIVRKIRGLEASSAGQPEESRLDLLRKKFKLPCYIVITYICFNLTSTIMLTLSRYGKNWYMLGDFSQLPLIIGVISDAFLYLFTNKSVRALLCSLCRKRISQNRISGETL